MKKNFLFVFIALFTTDVTLAQNFGFWQKQNNSLAAKPAPCSQGTATADLDIGNVRATILTDGDMWWDLSNARYEVPKGSGKHSLYTGAIWFGGIDGLGQVKVAGQTYRQSGNDWWPGPIDTVNVSTNATVCTAYDKFWKVTRASVFDFATNGTTTPEILSWPGNGDGSQNHGQILAPFFDGNGDGIYDPSQGDFPNYDLLYTGLDCFGVLHGDQTLWWAFNDVGNIHSQTNSDPIGLEVHAQAFAYFSSSPAISNTTFYQYKLINRSSNSMNNCYIGNWVDPDLGFAQDDYVGCDVGRGLAYCYNGDNDDEGISGYGIDPPAVGIDFLIGPPADLSDGIDNNYNGIIDEPCEDVTMSKFIHYGGMNNTPNGDPQGFHDYYNYLSGIWLDNIPMTYGGDGRNPGSPICNFMFPGDTDSALNASNGPWSEITAGNLPEDRRFLQSAGPFTMLPGEINYVITAVPWARTTSGGGAQGSLADLKLADDTIQMMFSICCIQTGMSSVDANPFQVIISPVPFHEETTVSFSNRNADSFTLTLYDIKGKRIRQIRGITGNEVSLNRAGINSGIYIIKLTDSKDRSYSQKIVAD